MLITWLTTINPTTWFMNVFIITLVPFTVHVIHFYTSTYNPCMHVQMLLCYIVTDRMLYKHAAIIVLCSLLSFVNWLAHYRSTPNAVPWFIYFTLLMASVFAVHCFITLDLTLVIVKICASFYWCCCRLTYIFGYMSLVIWGLFVPGQIVVNHFHGGRSHLLYGTVLSLF